MSDPEGDAARAVAAARLQQERLAREQQEMLMRQERQMMELAAMKAALAKEQSALQHELMKQKAAIEVAHAEQAAMRAAAAAEAAAKEALAARSASAAVGGAGSAAENKGESKSSLPPNFQQSTVLLLCDYQNLLLERNVGKDKVAAFVAKSRAVADHARRNKIPVVYTQVAFRPGYPELSSQNKMLSGLKSMGTLIDGAEGTNIHKDIAPLTGEVVVTKRRVSALHNTDLGTVLSAHNAKHIVLLGVRSAGVILSTTRAAADQDFLITILEDCCADADAEIHNVLMGKVFPLQATISKSQDFLDLKF